MLAAVPQDRVLIETDGPYVRLGNRSVRPEDVTGIVVSLAERWKLQPKIALGDLHPDVGLQWSPDGRFLAFTAMIDGEHGLWVYSIEDDTVRGTLAEGIALAAWSPDGMLIASLMFRGEGINAPADVWVIDASELVGGTA